MKYNLNMQTITISDRIQHHTEIFLSIIFPRKSDKHSPNHYYRLYIFLLLGNESLDEESITLPTQPCIFFIRHKYPGIVTITNPNNINSNPQDLQLFQVCATITNYT